MKHTNCDAKPRKGSLTMQRMRVKNMPYGGKRVRCLKRCRNACETHTHCVTPYGGKRNGVLNDAETCVKHVLYDDITMKHKKRINWCRHVCGTHSLWRQTEENAKGVLNDAEMRVLWWYKTENTKSELTCADTCVKHTHCNDIRRKTQKASLIKNWMFNFVSLLKYKRQMTGNKLCKPAQRSRAGLHIICYRSSDVYTSINWQN